MGIQVTLTKEEIDYLLFVIEEDCLNIFSDVEAELAHSLMQKLKIMHPELIVGTVVERFCNIGKD